MTILKITPKQEKGKLEVWINQEEKTISIKGKTNMFRQLQASSFTTEKGKITIQYGIDEHKKRDEDAEKIKNNNLVEMIQEKYQDSRAPQLYLHFPKGTKIAIANYD